MKKLNLFIILIFLISLNYSGRFIVNLVSEKSVYNFTINLIAGICLAILVLVLFKMKVLKKPTTLSSLILAQGIIFYFLLTQPRLFDKIILTGFYFTGIFLAYSDRNKNDIYFILYALIISFLFELSGFVLFENNFLYLIVLRNLILATAGYTTGRFLHKN